jgi:transposase-like protein
MGNAPGHHGNVYGDELRAKILTRADEIGVPAAAAEFRVNPASLYNWRAAQFVGPPKPPKRQTTGRGFSKAEHLRVIAMARSEQYGPEHAARVWKVPLEVVTRWVNSAIARERLKKYNAQEGQSMAENTEQKPSGGNGQKPPTTIAIGKKVGSRRSFSQSEKARVVAYANTHSVEDAGRHFGIVASVIRRWLKRAAKGGALDGRRANAYPEKRKPRKIFDDQTRSEIVAYAHAHGIDAAAAKYGLEASAIYRWRKGWRSAASKQRGRPVGPGHPEFPAHKEARLLLREAWRHITAARGTDLDESDHYVALALKTLEKGSPQ